MQNLNLDTALTLEQVAQEKFCEAINARIELNSLTLGWKSIALRKIFSPAIETKVEPLGVVVLSITRQRDIKAVTNTKIWEGRDSAGQLHIIPGDLDVTWKLPEGSEGLILTFNPEIFETIMDELNQIGALEITPAFFSTDPFIERTMRELIREIRKDALGSSIFAESSGQLLALHLIRKHSNLSKSLKGFATLSPPINQMRRAEDFMVANMAKPISLSDIAKEANLNMFYFVKCFRDWKGKTPYRFLMDLRMEEARKLLINSTLSIEEISYKIGFKNATNFSTAFREHFGLPPLRYRKITQ